MKKSVSALLAISLTFIPDAAIAGANKSVQPPSGKARSDQYAKVLKWCQSKYGGSGMVSVEWAGHYGKTAWWCRHRL